MWSTLVIVHEHLYPSKKYKTCYYSLFLLLYNAYTPKECNSGNIVVLMDKYHPSYGGNRFP